MTHKTRLESKWLFCQSMTSVWQGVKPTFPWFRIFTMGSVPIQKLKHKNPKTEIVAPKPRLCFKYPMKCCPNSDRKGPSKSNQILCCALQNTTKLKSSFCVMSFALPNTMKKKTCSKILRQASVMLGTSASKSFREISRLFSSKRCKHLDSSLVLSNMPSTPQLLPPGRRRNPSYASGSKLEAAQGNTEGCFTWKNPASTDPKCQSAELPGEKAN